MTATDTRNNATDNAPANDAGNGPQTAGTATGTATAPVSPIQLAGAVWGALNANPGASAATIATAAGVSMPTARRALNELEAAGYATRTPGGHRDGKRVPDAWNASPATDTTGTTPEAAGDTADGTDTAAATAAASDDGTAPAPSAEVPSAAEATGDDPTTDTADDGGGDGGGEGDPDGDEEAATDPADVPTPGTGTPPADEAVMAQTTDEEGAGMDPAAVTEAREALTALSVAVTRALSALQAGERDATLAAAETFYTGSGRARRLVRAAAHRRPRGASGVAHSAPGQLRAKVAAHLAAHPGKEFTPHEISKVIGHSAGAIANALDRLVALGQAMETCERPRRFAATEQAATPVGAATGTANA